LVVPPDSLLYIPPEATLKMPKTSFVVPAGSPLNTLDPRNDIKVGSAANPCSGSDSCNRYGDYFGAATDPSNPSIIWVAGQYHDSVTWSTWIGTFSVSDADVDGVEDSVDNCPDDANPNQEDADNDDIGDVCDALLNDPNKQCVNQTGNWNNAGSWFPVGIPSSTERLVMINCDLTIQAGETVVVGNILDVDSNSILNINGDMTVTGQVNLEGTANVNSNSLLVFGTYNVQSGGIHNNNAGGKTEVKNGGNFNLQTGGKVNDAGIHITRTTGTTTVSGDWDKLGSRNTVFGTFNVASGGMYDNKASALTKITSGGNFNLQTGGKVNLN